MLKWFAFDHLPSHLKEVSFHFAELANQICMLVEPGPERTVALRKLLEAKDAAVRAKVNPGGWQMKCKSCGDSFDLDGRLWRLERNGISPHKHEHLYCEECADELFRGRIKHGGANLHSAGRGRGIGEDPSPWQENAVRCLEG